MLCQNIKAKMAQWTSETGILRKNKPKENHEELLVFGYACKLFRDDEKALYIDQGKHLIPWMADEKLKIDRYDCRGALSDLKRFEASREGYDAMRWLGLSDSDRKLEELCDKERYYSLLINEEEEEMYKEEEQKRQKTNAIQYSYDVPPPPKEEGPAVPEEEEEEYVPLPSLDVPVDINIPKTVKEYARIEKTAVFVCNQGPQMEILLKAKQGDNPQFGFLNQGDGLYKFYRHVLHAFKSGRYQGQVKKTEQKQEDQQEDTSGHYLHPSLIASNSQPEVPPPPSTLPSVPYKPSANCTYSQLVNRIQGNSGEMVPEQPYKTQEVPQTFAQLTYEQQQYYHYYYTAQYYEYYKQLAQYQQNCGESQGQIMPPPDFQLDPSMQAYFQQIAYAQYMQQHQQQAANSNSYAQIVSNVNKDSNPYTANVPTLPQTVPPLKPPENPVVEPVKEIRTVIKVVPEANVTLKKPLLSLAQYGSDSEDEDMEAEEKENGDVKPEQKQVFLVPTGETQIVIDKMAVYVSKNGEQFEEIVKAKGDPRFEFLNSNHEYNKYYRNKILDLKEDKSEKQNSVETKVKNEPVKVKSPVKVKDEKEKKKIIAPVSFSIKKPKEEPPKEIKSALPLEESDEDESEDNGNLQTSSAVTPPINAPNPPDASIIVQEVKTEIVQHLDAKNGSVIDVDDPILEMIDLTYDAEERKDAKRAEDRIKDKLAAAAREKLASATRDKALQLERKKKAAAFLKLKSSQNIAPIVEGSRRNSTDVELSTERIVSRSASKERSSSKEKRLRDTREKSSSSSRKSPSSDRDRRSEDRYKSRSYHSDRRSRDRDYKSVEREPSSSRRSEDRDRRIQHKVRSSDRRSLDRRSSDRDREKERKSSDREKRRSEERSRHRERSKSTEKEKRGRSPKKDLTVILEEGETVDSDIEEKKKKKSSKKKKSHKRKRSKSKSDSSRSRKKSKKRHRRSSSCSSSSS